MQDKKFRRIMKLDQNCRKQKKELTFDLRLRSSTCVNWLWRDWSDTITPSNFDIFVNQSEGETNADTKKKCICY
jgi:hypothetical protein